MLTIGVLVSGSGTNLQSIIDAIETGRLDARISVVLSDNPQAYALERAEEHGMETCVITKKEFSKREDYDRRAVEVLNAHGVELVVLAGFMRILSPVFVRAFPLRIMNIHPSLLPAFPGLDVHGKAIESGARFSGCTVHFVDEGVDTGPIIIQAVVPIRDDDTPETLRQRILTEEHRIYPEAIRLFGEGRLTVEGRRVRIRDGRFSEGVLINPAIEDE